MSTELQLDINANIQSAVAQLNKLNKTVDNVASSAFSLKSAFDFAKNAILPLLAIDTVIRTVESLISSADVLDDTFKKLSSISAQTGQNFEDLKTAAIDLSSDGLIPLEDSALAIRNLLRGGLNIKEATKLLNAFKETAALGRAEGLSLADAIKNAATAFNQAASTGFQTVNVKMLRTAGIFIDVKKANEEYAKSIGVTVKSLTQYQKEQALLNALLQEGEKRSGDYAKVQNDFGSAFSKIGAEVKLFLGTLGLLFTENESVKQVLMLVGESAEILRKNLQVMTGDLKEAELQTAKTSLAMKLFDFTLNSLGFKNLKQIQQDSKDMQSLANGINAVIDGISKPTKNNLLDQIQSNLEAVGITINKVFDKKNVILEPEINTEQLTKDLETVQKQLKNVGESELAQVKNDSIERNRIINDSFKKELIDIDKKNKLIAKSNQKLAFDSIKANDEIEKRRQEAIDRAIKEGEKNPIKVLYEAIPAKVTNLFNDIGLSIGNVIPRQIPDFFSGAFEKMKGFFSSVGNLLSSLVPQGVKDFFKSKPDKNLSPQEQKQAELLQAKIGAAGKALVSSIGQGALGAKNLISKGLEAALGPALGPVAGELFSVLSSGPDAVRSMVDQFTGAIPVLIENFISSIPVFIERLIVGLSDALVKIADKLPEMITQFVKGIIHSLPLIIQSLVLLAPNFILALIKGIPRLINSLIEMMPSVAVSFSTALIAQAPSIGVAVANAIVDELKGKLGKIAGGAGDIFGDIGGFISDIGSSFGFARGGELRGGTPFKDSVPVMAQGGELFVDRSTTDQLKSFLDANQQEKTMTDNIMFARLIEAMNKPQVVETELKFNSDTFANIILKLNRQNARLA